MISATAAGLLESHKQFWMTREKCATLRKDNACKKIDDKVNPPEHFQDSDLGNTQLLAPQRRRRAQKWYGQEATDPDRLP